MAKLLDQLYNILDQISAYQAYWSGKDDFLTRWQPIYDAVADVIFEQMWDELNIKDTLRQVAKVLCQHHVQFHARRTCEILDFTSESGRMFHDLVDYLDF